VGGRHHPRLRGGRLYIRPQEEFAYLAIILDAFSRRVIGWAMADHLGAGLAVAALTMALTARRPPWGSLVHHSDRGVQYACAEYTRLLDAHGIAASMSRVGNLPGQPSPQRTRGGDSDTSERRDGRGFCLFSACSIRLVGKRSRI
jgi:transposase InsO family protein